MNLYHPLIICINGIEKKERRRKGNDEDIPPQKINPGKKGGDTDIRYNEVANVLLCNYYDDLIRLYRIIKLLHEPGNLEWLSRSLTCKNILRNSPDKDNKIISDNGYVYINNKDNNTVKAEALDGFINIIETIHKITFNTFGDLKIIQLPQYHKTKNGMLNELITIMNKNSQSGKIKYLKLIDKNNLRQLSNDDYVWSGFIPISSKIKLKGGLIKSSLTMFLIIALTIILVIILVVITKKDDEREDLFFLT